MTRTFKVTYWNYNEATGENRPFIERWTRAGTPRSAVVRTFKFLRPEWKFLEEKDWTKIAVATHPDGRMITSRLEEAVE